MTVPPKVPSDVLHAITEAQSSSSEASMTKRPALVVIQSDVQQLRSDSQSAAVCAVFDAEAWNEIACASQ
jgi:hypothetical protein